MRPAAFQPPNTFQRKNPTSLRVAPLIAARKHMTLFVKARGLLRGCGSYSLNA
jgi:hypothetical protein